MARAAVVTEAAGDVKEVDAGVREGAGSFGSFRRRVSAGKIVAGAESQGNGIIRPHRLSDRRRDHQREPETFRHGLPAVEILPQVCDGGQELAEKIGVGGVDLHAVEPGFLHSDGSRGEILRDAVHLFRCEDGRIKIRVAKARGMDAAGRKRLKVCHPAFRRTAGMVDLGDHRDSMFMDHFRDPPQPRNVAVPGHRQLAFTGLSFRTHEAVLRHDEPEDPGGRLFVVVSDKLVRHSGFHISLHHCHRRQEDAVFQSQVSDGQGCVENLHKNLPENIAGTEKRSGDAGAEKRAGPQTETRL